MKIYNLLKTHCRNIFLAGSGNFWYEEGTIGDDSSILYRAYSLVLFTVYGTMTILEVLAATIGNFPDDEKRDAVTFAVSHVVVMIKIFSVISHKERVKSLNRDMVNICAAYEESAAMSAQYRIIKINVAAYLVTVYGAAACFVFEGLRKMHEGSHFVAVVTYYPYWDDSSVSATTLRVAFPFVLLMMMMTMVVTVDSFTMMHLIMYQYKFITLRHYFENLRSEFDKVNDAGDSGLAAEKLEKGLIEGIKMHEELLRMSKEIHGAFGTVMAFQLGQSSGSAVSLLLQMVLSDQLTFVAGLKIFLFVTGLFLMLALFLCNAGEITYQASLLADSIFQCGWHACPLRAAHPARRNVRRLALQACSQAQQPLVMKAFKMVELTYGTFLTVARGTYAVFALFYAQHQNQ